MSICETCKSGDHLHHRQLYWYHGPQEHGWGESDCKEILEAGRNQCQCYAQPEGSNPFELPQPYTKLLCEGCLDIVSLPHGNYRGEVHLCSECRRPWTPIRAAWGITDLPK